MVNKDFQCGMHNGHINPNNQVNWRKSSKNLRGIEQINLHHTEH